MRVVLPVKKLTAAKSRLAAVLEAPQRRELSRLMCADVLAVLEASALVSRISVISSDQSIAALPAHAKTEVMLNAVDQGYCRDTAAAIEKLNIRRGSHVLIIPADVPQLAEADLQQLHAAHAGGITLCPASEDGGANAVLYTAPLGVPLLFGPDSFNRYREAAAQANINLVITKPPGLLRDIDRHADLLWLSRQPSAGRAAQYSRTLLQGLVRA